MFKKNENFTNLEDRMYKAVTPGKDKANYIGLELEVSIKVPHQVLTWEMAKLGVKVAVGTDGSIRRTPKAIDTAEVRLLIKQSEVAEVVPKVISVLKELGAAVNASCGMHVHLDMRNRKVAECYTKLVKKQAILRKMVAKGRLRNQYCRKNKHEDFELAVYGTKKEIKYDYGDGHTGTHLITDIMAEGRSSINPHSYKKHKTLEVRLHEGTLDDKKIIKWVNKLVEIVDEVA